MHALQRARLAEDISWCQQYAAINRIGLQRLVEQHDRSHDSSAGAAFYEVTHTGFDHYKPSITKPSAHDGTEPQCDDVVEDGRNPGY